MAEQTDEQRERDVRAGLAMEPSDAIWPDDARALLRLLDASRAETARALHALGIMATASANNETQMHWAVADRDIARAETAAERVRAEELRKSAEAAWDMDGLNRVNLTLANQRADAAVAKVADAWDEGNAAGRSRAMRMMSDEPSLSLHVPNPYRAALADQGGDRG